MDGSQIQEFILKYKNLSDSEFMRSWNECDRNDYPEEFFEALKTLCLQRNLNFHQNRSASEISAQILSKEEKSKLENSIILKNMKIGIFTFVLGIAISVATYNNVSEKGGIFIIFWGAILYGFVTIIINVFKFFKNRKIDKN